VCLCLFVNRLLDKQNCVLVSLYEKFVAIILGFRLQFRSIYISLLMKRDKPLSENLFATKLKTVSLRRKTILNLFFSIHVLTSYIISHIYRSLLCNEYGIVPRAGYALLT
jgi:hypothetical protein